MWINEWVSQSGTTLAFREHKQSNQKRLVVQMDKIVKVEVRKDSSLANSRCIYIEAADVKVVVAPVKDTEEEINYWLNGLKKMQARFNNSSSKPTPTIPKKALPIPSDDDSASSSPTKFTRVAPSPQVQRASSLAELPLSIVPTISSNSSNSIGNSSASAATSATSPLAATSEGSLSIGRLRNKTVTAARSSAEVSEPSPTSSPKVSRVETSSGSKLEGWLQVYGVQGKNTSSKSLFGTLKKMTTSKWCPYWCTVSGSTLHMFKSQEDATLLGDIDLDQVSLVEETSDKEMVGRVLRLSMLSGDTNLICPKESDFTPWNDRIMSVVASARSKNPAVTASAGASLSSSSPSISRTSLFKGRSSTAMKAVVERAAPLPGETLSGWVFAEEGDKWTRQWLAQKGTILSMLASADEGAASRGGYDLLILTKIEQSPAPEAFGPAITCWFGEFNTFVFSPERGQHAYWMTGLGMVVEKYKPKVPEKRAAVAAPPASCMFAVGQQVWAQFAQDSLWYRAVIDAAREGDVYDVTFSEYRNQQRDCPINTIRPIDDPAMLALLGTTIEAVTAVGSVDRNRPMSVQIPASIAQALRKGTFVQIDPALVVREQQLQAAEEEKQQQQQEQQFQLQMLQQEEMVQQDIPEEDSLSSEATIASSPVSQTSIMSRKTVDAMYVKVLEDDDDDEDEVDLEEAKKREEHERNKKRIEEEEERKRREEEDVKRKRREEEEEEEEEKKKIEEEKRREEEEEMRKREAEKRIKEQEEEKKKKLAVEEEKKRLYEEECALKDAEEKRLREEEERLIKVELEAQRRAAEEATKQRQAEERREKLRLAKLAKEEERRSRSEEEKTAASSPAARHSAAPLPETPQESSAAAVAPSEGGRSAAVQAALARAKALTAAVKTDNVASAPTKPLPDPFQ